MAVLFIHFYCCCSAPVCSVSYHHYILILGGDGRFRRYSHTFALATSLYCVGLLHQQPASAAAIFRPPSFLDLPSAGSDVKYIVIAIFTKSDLGPASSLQYLTSGATVGLVYPVCLVSLRDPASLHGAVVVQTSLPLVLPRRLRLSSLTPSAQRAGWPWGKAAVS